MRIPYPPNFFTFTSLSLVNCLLVSKTKKERRIKIARNCGISLPIPVLILVKVRE